MDSSTLAVLKRIYGATTTPVAVYDAGCGHKNNILWMNPAAEASGLFDGVSAEFLCGGAEEGTVSLLVKDAYRLFNVMKCEGEDTCLIAEYVGKDCSRDISHMKDYFIYLISRLRESASQISMAACDIDLFLKMGETEVASQLNRIDRNVMLLLKETVIPEHLFYAADPYCRNDTLNLAEAVAVVAEDTERTLGRSAEVWQNAEDGVCAQINKDVFEAALALMTAESCCGELFPEKVEFAVERDKENDGRACVSVRGISLSGKKNEPMKLEALKKNEFFTASAFKAVLAEKYAAKFDKKQHSDGIECIMLLDVMPKGRGIVRSEPRDSIRDERFSSTVISLSEKHYGERYKNIKMK